MKISYIISCTLVAGSLIFCTENIHAAQKKKSPPIESNLNITERWCQYFGRVVGAIATDRDNLVPLTIEVSRLRTVIRNVFKQYPQLPHEEKLTEEMVQVSYVIYATPAVSSQMARHAFEVGCLNPQITKPVSNSLIR